MQKEYPETITLTLNTKGVLDLDTVKGCAAGMALNPRGCYGLCYAAKIAAFRGWDFSKSVNRVWGDARNRSRILDTLKRTSKKWVRIGTMGDPSMDWAHTLRVLFDLSITGKVPVVITKHWNVMTRNQVETMEYVGAVLNTSISALDTPAQIAHRLTQFHGYRGRSILRFVSCDFNRDNEQGAALATVQDELFRQGGSRVIDTPLRLNGNYPLLVEGVIKAGKYKDAAGYDIGQLVSLYKKDAFLGHCRRCPDQCGVK